jgi:hypothetical protein
MLKSLTKALVCCAVLFGVAGVSKGNPFESVKDCVVGKRVTVTDNGPGKIVGLDKWSPGLMCAVLLDSTGKQQSFIYWKLQPEGAVDRKPDSVQAGGYTCSTFSDKRIQLIPAMDFKVTGPSSYVGRDGKQASFTYDQAKGVVTFRGGTLSGIQANYDSWGGGVFYMLKDGHPANTDCHLDKH